MFAYYLRLGWKSLRRHPALTGLIMLAVGLGVGVAMTLFSVHYTMSLDPIPHKSDQLYAVRIDSWSPEEPYNDERPEEPPWQLTYRDAMALLESDVPLRQTAMFKSVFSVNDDAGEIKPFFVVSRMAQRDFFGMFEVPFLYGGPWNASADVNPEQVVVLSKETNDKVFGGEDSVGQLLKLGDDYFTVTGVIDEWQPLIKYYDLNNSPMGDTEDLFMPISITPTMELSNDGNTNCWKREDINTYEDRLASECIWLQFWAELPTSEMRARYQDWLAAYVNEQKKLGRLERPMNNRLDDVNAWMEVNEVVPEDLSALLGLAFLFLAVCLFNAVGLLLARFLAKAPVVALRRAVGASKRAIFSQHLIEVALIGVGGGLVGILFALLGLAGLRGLVSYLDQVAVLNWTLSGIAIGIAVIATLLAGIYPTWRICRVAPSSQLKTQ
ncbi:MAG: ABC transporter permease [Xanthomonadales bacterium]|nr:ABC transporter permease [Xanthomonadales bacterium]